MEVKVLGPGCAKCKTTYATVEKVIRDNGLDATLTKVDDIVEMMRYNILSCRCHRRGGEGQGICAE